MWLLYAEAASTTHLRTGGLLLSPAATDCATLGAVADSHCEWQPPVSRGCRLTATRLRTPPAVASGAPPFARQAMQASSRYGVLPEVDWTTDAKVSGMERSCPVGGRLCLALPPPQFPPPLPAQPLQCSPYVPVSGPMPRCYVPPLPMQDVSYLKPTLEKVLDELDEREAYDTKY